MLLSLLYLLLFLAAGFLLARRALPDAGISLLIPLGCGYGISLLAVLPAIFALFLGFTEIAAVLAVVCVLALLWWLLYHDNHLTSRFHDPDHGVMWLCLLPLLLVTIYLLHTHILHEVNGALHTGQSCYGDLPMHLGFIEYIAQSGEFPPTYPLLGGEHRFGYPFLCETVSSVFRVLGADLRTAYLLPVLPAVLSVFGMFWQLARRVLQTTGKACFAFYLFFLGSGFGFVYFLGSPSDFLSIFTGFYTTPTNYTVQNIVWVNPIVDLMIPQRATLFGWSILLPALYLLWRFCYEEQRRLALWMALLVLPLPLLHTHSALALVLLCLVGGIYTLLHHPRTRTVLLPWGLLALVCGLVWLAQMLPTVLAQSVDGQNMLRLHFNWINGQDDGTLKDNYFWFLSEKYRSYLSAPDSGLVPRLLETALVVRRWTSDLGTGGNCSFSAQYLRQQQASLCVAYVRLLVGSPTVGRCCRTPAASVFANRIFEFRLLCKHVRQRFDGRA